MRIGYLIAALALSLPASWPAANANATSPPANAPATSSAATPDASQMIEFQDAHGKPIDPAAFTAALKSGQRYVTRKDMQGARFVLKLLPAGVNAPGSMSYADMTTGGFSMIEVGGVHYKVVFHDEHGNVIDQARFAAGAAQHQHYVTRLDKHAGTAVLTLLPLGVKKRGSQPTSDWIAESPMEMERVPKVGTLFPALDLPSVGGGRINSASLQGRPYVVDFFFADCIGCIAELPVLNAYHTTYPKQPLFAVTFDDAKTAAGFVKQRKFNWPVAHDGKKFLDGLGVKVYPTMVVVGADGKVLATRVGSDDSMTVGKLEKWIVASIHGTKAPSTKP